MVASGGLRLLRAANLAAKALLLGLLVYAVVRTDLPQFQGKAMGGRLWTFGLATVAVPVAWLAARGRRGGRAYPDVLDLLVVAPFLMDTIGNALNLYDSVEVFDDVLHFATWLPWVTAFGLALHYAPPLPRWAHAGLVVAFGAVTHILWELAEYVTFIRFNPNEYRTAYPDTLGDLALSLAGTIAGALLVTTALWEFGRRAARPAPGARGSGMGSGPH